MMIFLVTVFTTVNPLFSRGLFNLEKMMVSVFHKDLKYKVDKLKYKMVGGHAAKDENQIQTFSW